MRTDLKVCLFSCWYNQRVNGRCQKQHDGWMPNIPHLYHPFFGGGDNVDQSQPILSMNIVFNYQNDGCTEKFWNFSPDFLGGRGVLFFSLFDHLWEGIILLFLKMVGGWTSQSRNFIDIFSRKRCSFCRSFCRSLKSFGKSSGKAPANSIYWLCQ